jgi:hypothetical protein
MSGQIIDVAIVAAPKQRNTEGEKRDIREGRIPPNRELKTANRETNRWIREIRVTIREAARRVPASEYVRSERSVGLRKARVVSDRKRRHIQLETSNNCASLPKKPGIGCAVAGLVRAIGVPARGRLC